MPTINGKKVTFRSRFPARDYWDLPQQLAEVAAMGQQGKMDLQKMVPVLSRMVESWEFGGDPKNADAYGDLDIFRELLPLVQEAAQHVGEMTGRGEAGSGRTLP